MQLRETSGLVVILLPAAIAVNHSALAEQSIGPHPDGTFYECSDYRKEQSPRIDPACAGFGIPPMRDGTLIRGAGCFSVTYKNGRIVTKRQVRGEPIVSSYPGECSR
jgi:hypothetical protein